jgi:GTP-binding protein
MAKQIKDRRMQRISTGLLNRELLAEIEKVPPPSIGGRDLRINYITQVNTEPPVFAFFCNHPQLIPDSYKRYIENTLRKMYNFEGTPISFVFRNKHVDKYANS